MILLCLRPDDLAVLLASTALPPTTRAVILAQSRDPRFNGSAPRTLTIRDEGDGLPQMVVVRYDLLEDADLAWEQLEWPERPAGEADRSGQ